MDPFKAIIDWWDSLPSQDVLSVANVPDSGMDARVRAYGVDPSTGKFVSPQYDNGQDPAEIAAAARADYTSSYNYFYQRLDALNNPQTPPWQIVLYVILAIVVLILIVKIAG